MAYREFQVSVTVADDSNKSSVSFDRQAFIYQTKDLEAGGPPVIRIGPADAEAQVSIAPVTTAYGVAVMSDYPVRLRFNSPSGTQFIMHTNSVPATNSGAPYPPQCCFIATAEITSIYVQPIANAARVATVWLTAVGDPESAYV